MKFLPSILTFLTIASDVSSFQSQSLSLISHQKSCNSNRHTSNSHSVASASQSGKRSSCTALMGISPSLLTSSLTLSSTLPSLPSSITSPLGSVTVLALVILIHELGHFSAARSFNINVQEFSVGVGPKVFGFTRNTVTGKIDFGNRNDKAAKGEGSDKNDDDVQVVDNPPENPDEIQFNLRAIPLGGYVRFPENYNTTQEYQLEVEADKKREEIKRIIKENRGSTEKGTGLIASVSSIFERYTKEERILALQSMAEELNEKKNTSSSWWNNIIKNKKTEKIESEERRSIIIEEDGTVSTPPIEYYDDPNLLQNRGWAQRAVVLAGGVVFNLILAFSLYFGELTVAGGMPRPVFDQGAMVSTMPRIDGPSANILNRGDVIIALNGKQLSLESSPSIYKSQEAINKLISDIRATPPGDVLHFSVVKAESRTISDINIKPEPMTKNDPNSPLSIGVMIGPNFKGQELVKASSVFDAISIASTEVAESTSQNAKSILTYLGTLVQGGSGKATGQSLSGPIGVIKAGSDVVSSNNISAVIGFMAAISINLAVVNALPLPALDGGQLLFVMAEAVTGRKIDQRLQESINSTALLFLLFVTFSTAIGDISKIAIFK